MEQIIQWQSSKTLICIDYYFICNLNDDDDDDDKNQDYYDNDDNGDDEYAGDDKDDKNDDAAPSRISLSVNKFRLKS